jgi:hypothetical protein
VLHFLPRPFESLASSKFVKVASTGRSSYCFETAKVCDKNIFLLIRVYDREDESDDAVMITVMIEMPGYVHFVRVVRNQSFKLVLCTLVDAIPVNVANIPAWCTHTLV